MNVKSPNNISKWQMGFNLAFKGLILSKCSLTVLLENEVVGLMPNSKPGGAGFHFGVCYPREIGKLLKELSMPPLCWKLSAPLLETRPAWVTLPVATLPLTWPSALLGHAILPACRGGGRV
jgi:hypothetical protein